METSVALRYVLPLWPIVGLPALGAALIFIFSRQITARGAGLIGCLSVALSFAWVAVSGVLLVSPGYPPALQDRLWTWLDAGNLRADVAFYFDRIALVFCLVVTGVGLLIHLFSLAYMRGDDGERRYFGYLNLFVASMLVLVTADNSFLMFLGWEGVGACSLFLIGHWYDKPENVAAAQKAFYVTRLGDVFLLLGLILCAGVHAVWFPGLETALTRVDQTISFAGFTGKTLLTVAALLMLGGVMGKSAQLPLQMWLPDAMAGPTPVSALIHAATMVTAGVYLIARFHVLFALTPEAMSVVAVVGVATAFYGATCALVQTDIKRVLAYSTISQIGYMILAMGVGAFSLGLFHFFTHGFFKALLFLGAGAIIHSIGGEQNIYNMGRLKDKLKLTFLVFLAGAATLAGIPGTSGFFSKDAILWASLTTPLGGWPFYAVALLTAFLTSIYSFRLVLIVFGEHPGKESRVHHPERLLTWPLAVLALFSLTLGLLNLPAAWHIVPLWERFFEPVFGHWQDLPSKAWHADENKAIAASAAIAIAGLLLARATYRPGRKPFPAPAGDISQVVNTTPAPYRSRIANLAFHGWGFDAVVNLFFVHSYRRLSSITAWVDHIVIDGLYYTVALLVRGGHRVLLSFQNGRVSRYAFVMLFGAVVLLAVIMSIAGRVP